MVYRIVSINADGRKVTAYFNVLSFDELWRFIRKHVDDRFCEILEIKCVVRDFVEAISYTSDIKTC